LDKARRAAIRQTSNSAAQPTHFDVGVGCTAELLLTGKPPPQAVEALSVMDKHQEERQQGSQRAGSACKSVRSPGEDNFPYVIFHPVRAAGVVFL
jgi:hypothetical protein